MDDLITDSRYSWVRLGLTLFVATIINAGMWAIIVIMPAIEAEYGGTRAMVSLPYTLTMVGFALGNYIIGRAVDHFGITASLIVAAIMTAIGFGLATLSSSLLILSVFEQFAHKHPLIDLRILATCDLLDLTRLEADIAIRISRNPGDTLKGHRLLEPQSASYANQNVANRISLDPTAMIDWIVHDVYPSVPKSVSSQFPNNRVRFRFDDMLAMVGAAQAGMGVVPLPMFLGRSADGLVQLPVLPPQPFADIWLVGHPDVWSSPKLRAFRDVLINHCKLHSHQFVA